jgi:hypothetical protein
MGRFFRGVTELSTSSLKRTFKLLRLRLNPRPYNKLDKKVKDFKDL